MKQQSRITLHFRNMKEGNRSKKKNIQLDKTKTIQEAEEKWSYKLNNLGEINEA